MGFKVILIRSITAVICVIAICVTASIGTDKICEAKINAVTAKGVTEDGEIAEEVISDDISTPEQETTDVAEEVIDEQGETVTVEDNNTANDSVKDSTVAANSSATSSSAPKTTAQIISYYNNATKKVVSSKAGFSKSRVTDNEKIDANAIVKSFKSLIYQFMGIGAENKYNETVAKGNWGEKPFFLVSNLGASDVTKATCNYSNGVYTITLTLKDGSSAADKSNPTTPANSSLDKCGICVGTEDKKYFDHKTASVIYDAIAGTYAGAEVKESYSNAKVIATINEKSGQLTSLKVDWNAAVTISKILGMTAYATGISHVVYSGFKY